MTTITIDDPVLERIIQEKKYTQAEIQNKFLIFIQHEFINDYRDEDGFDELNNKVKLVEVNEDNLSERAKNRLENMDKLNFINY